MKKIENINVNELISLINKKWLFNGLWQLKGEDLAGEEEFEGICEDISKYKFEPKMVFDFFEADYDGRDLRLYSKDSREIARFSLNTDAIVKLIDGAGIKPRSTLVLSPARGEKVKVALICATVGDSVKEFAELQLRQNGYQDYFYLVGFAAALTEALTEYGHRLVSGELGWTNEHSFRISPGYPAWPELADQLTFQKLLPLDEIEVCVSETLQLIPELSTTSMAFKVY